MVDVHGSSPHIDGGGAALRTARGFQFNRSGFRHPPAAHCRLWCVAGSAGLPQNLALPAFPATFLLYSSFCSFLNMVHSLPSQANGRSFGARTRGLRYPAPPPYPHPPYPLLPPFHYLRVVYFWVLHCPFYAAARCHACCCGFAFVVFHRDITFQEEVALRGTPTCLLPGVVGGTFPVVFHSLGEQRSGSCWWKDQVAPTPPVKNEDYGGGAYHGDMLPPHPTTTRTWTARQLDMGVPSHLYHMGHLCYCSLALPHQAVGAHHPNLPSHPCHLPPLPHL